MARSTTDMSSTYDVSSLSNQSNLSNQYSGEELSLLEGNRITVPVTLPGDGAPDECSPRREARFPTWPSSTSGGGGC
jgi:hypothetical protein